jgi:hypothetical protein
MRLQSLVVSFVLCGIAVGTAWGGTLAVTDPVSGTRAFGSVSISAAAATATVTITNAGSQTSVTGFTPAGAGCGEFTASATFMGSPVSEANPAILGSAEALVINVTYDPVDRVADTCAFTVVHNGAAATTFQLTGDGTAPVLQVTPGSLLFAHQPWNGGTPQVLEVTIANTGEEPIAQANLTATLATGTQFTLGTVTGLPISNGEMATVPVTFDPSSAGAKADTLTISLNNDAPADPNPIVSLSGSGIQLAGAPRGDFDGDGNRDILWRNAATGENYLYPMNGTAILGSEGYLRTVADQSWQVAGIGDFDGDGKADVLWRNSSTGENYVYLMNGKDIAGEGYLRTVADLNWRVAGVGDLDGDGKADIVWRNTSTGENYLYPMNGLAILGTEGYLRTVADQDWQIAGADNFDGNGTADILWRNSATGENYLYPMSGTAILGTEGYLRTVPDLAWTIAGTGDFDADGKADILWRNTSTGENYLYPMDGTTILGTEGYLRTVTDQNWQIKGTGDYDGDGKVDILWRNSSTGENYLYFMDGTTIKPTEGYLRTVADPGWRVALGKGGGPCGDSAGPGGDGIPCSCGDAVVTDTSLDLDPVTATTCIGDGLTLAAGVQLDLNGLTLKGNGSGNGISMPNGGGVQGGTVQGFRTGILVASATAGIQATATGMTVENNAGDGIHVRGAPGSSNLDDAAHHLEAPGYGFALSASSIRNNGGHGIHLGDTSQPADVAALIGGTQAPNIVHGNLGAGLLLEQATGLAPGADCGASAGQPGCTGATIMNNLIHDNADAGVELRAGFIIPLYVPGVFELGLGFIQNAVSHNAMAGAGCNVPQTKPQIHVTGPIGLSSAACSAAATPPDCEELNSPANQHCLWTGLSCTVSWDLRGGVGDFCSIGLRNAIYGYNTIDFANDSVGVRAINNSIARVDNNEWQSSSSSDNVTAGPGSFVGGTEVTCVSLGCGAP